MRSLPRLLPASVLALFAVFIPCTAARSHTQAVPQVAPSAPSPSRLDSAAPVFDVAAIHQHNPLPHERSHIVDSNGRFTTLNVTLKAIIQWAFDLPESRITGGPSWLGSARWDIEAKADNSIDMRKTYDTSAAHLEKRRMVQALLADRFHLAVHQETRELPIYALLVAKSGPKFLATQADGNKFDRWDGRIEIQGGDNTVEVLAEELAETLGRVVVDKTGIQGRYRLALTWMPDDRATPPSAASTTGASASDAGGAAGSGPSIFTAVQEQLGLKLESQKGPVSVLVIDHAQMPSEN